jgi:hypothetical protein
VGCKGGPCAQPVPGGPPGLARIIVTMDPPVSAPPLPALPDSIAPDALRELDDAALEGAAADLNAAERSTIAAMAPYDRRLREVRARLAELATERRRRERAVHIASRAAVRAAAGSGAMPTLADALAAAELPLPDNRPLREVRAFLKTGGEIGFGFATRAGVVSFTDGRRARQASTIGEARALWADGWEPGAPGVPGVRVHLAGTRVERVTSPEEVVLEVSPPAG